MGGVLTVWNRHHHVLPEPDVHGTGAVGSGRAQVYGAVPYGSSDCDHRLYALRRRQCRTKETDALRNAVLGDAVHHLCGAELAQPRWDQQVGVLGWNRHHVCIQHCLLYVVGSGWLDIYE